MPVDTAMELAKSEILWDYIKRYGWDFVPDCKKDYLLLRVFSLENARYVYTNFREILKIWAKQFGLSSIIIRYGEENWDFIDFEVCISPEKILASPSTSQKVLSMTQIFLSKSPEIINGLDYKGFHETILEATEQNLIIAAVSNITNICLQVNGNLEASRAVWKPSRFIGFNYLEFWRETLDQLEQLKNHLSLDGNVSGFEYEGIRPDGARCRYSTDYYLLTYLDEPVRFAVSRKEDFQVVRPAPVY